MRTNSRKWCLAAALALMTTAACVDDQPTGLTITDVVAVQLPDCNISADSNVVMTNGVLDIIDPYSASSTVDVVPGYYLPLRMTNLLKKVDDLNKMQIDEDGMEYQVESMRINVIGYRICLSYPQEDDPYRHCKDIPESLNYYVPTAAFVEQEGKSVDLPEVVSGKQLIEFFGDLSKIDVYGTTIVAHVVAVGREENGTQLESNEFLFPIKVCAGCRKISCPTGYVLGEACFNYQDTSPQCVSST